METTDTAFQAQPDRSAHIASVFKVLGEPTRLRIFEFLCSCAGSVEVLESGEVARVDGPTAGEVCCHITGADKITSTISFHLRELRQAGLITMHRSGQKMICCANPDAVAELRAYLHSLGEQRVTTYAEKA